MGQFTLNCDRTKMKAFIAAALLGLAAAAPAPDVSHHATINVGGVVSSAGHFAPHVGPAVVSHAAPVVAHAAPVVAHRVAPVVANAAPVVAHRVAPVVAHRVAPVVARAPVVAHRVAPVIAHAAPVVAHAVHAPVVAQVAPAYHAPAPAYGKAEVYPDEVSPYPYTYAVADDYSKANFNAEETSDGASNVQGSYSVALPDGRIQHVGYTSNGYDGYVADVTYEGTAQYPEYTPVAPAYKAAPAYHA